jgi:hypothetical protein
VIWEIAMGDEIKIDVELGGTVIQGQPFKWQNHGPQSVLASGLENVCDSGSYNVPAKANGKAGEKGALVLSSATLGPHTYNTGPGGNTPTLKVDSSMPKSR